MCTAWQGASEHMAKKNVDKLLQLISSLFSPEGNFVFVCMPRGRFSSSCPLRYLHCRLPNTEVGYWSSHIDPTRAGTQVAMQQPTTANFPQISLLLLRGEIQIFPLTEYNDGFGAPGSLSPPKCLCRHFEGKDANIAFFPAWWIFA